ncbi:hypothetical protein [Comamonas sp. NLF-1-9]|uniref:hypothetical protein n=1 Tax=Comamonas sp. NLF-1-9 TaxID=2853163 RepID=UPI001C47762D|nr:hypothetical protein [Comamonas sp. NLF-1-9]QXL85180.1 hypothetical protein KUD94_04170 [Comamonas sp. NLF-1-9]
MPHDGALALSLGGSFSLIAALAHLACIGIGPQAYRFMGAGERAARAAERGDRVLTLSTLGIAAVLALWALFAFSAAGLVVRLPLTRWVLLAVSAAYLARALAFPRLRSAFPGNSRTFWWVSSGVCLVAGALHAYGLARLWSSL